MNKQTVSIQWSIYYSLIKKIKTTDMLNNMNEPRNKYSESKSQTPQKKIWEEKNQIKKII